MSLGAWGWGIRRVQTAWLLLGLAVESPWLALGRLFLSSFAWMGLESGLLAKYNRASISGSEAHFSLCKGNH